jgi:hypothetical protein
LLIIEALHFQFEHRQRTRQRRHCESIALSVPPTPISLVANEGSTNGSCCSTNERPGSGRAGDAADQRATSRPSSTAYESTLFAVTQWS